MAALLILSLVRDDIVCINILKKLPMNHDKIFYCLFMIHFHLCWNECTAKLQEIGVSLPLFNT